MQYFCKLFIIDQRQPNENWKKKRKKLAFASHICFASSISSNLWSVTFCWCL